ncbi:MAG: SpoIIE family protein phosphatase [Alphaproteobacteria bacterium]|nr:SpoIIE family protein phosphatase [Alphaproteobacteria bacterium]
MIKAIKNWLKYKSLNFKLNVSILTCICLVFALLTFYITERAKPIIYKQTENIARQTLEAYSYDLGHLVKDTEQIIYNIKNTLNYFPKENISSIKITLNSAIETVYHSELNYLNAWVYVFNPDNVAKGTLYISSQEQNGEIVFTSENINNLYDRFEWFAHTPKQDKIYWTDPYLDKHSNQAVVTGLIPFKFIDNDKFNGLAALTVNLSDVQKAISNYSFYETGKLLFLSRSGLYITHPNPDIALKTTVYELSDKLGLPELASAGKEAFSGKKGKIELPFSSIYKSPTIYFYTPIEPINWAMFLAYEKNEFLKPLYQFRTLIFLSLLAGVIAISFIVYRICKHSTDQLLVLGQLAHEYGNGNFSDSFTQIPSSKDIDILSKALSNMRTDLLEYINKEKSQAIEKQKSISELEIARDIQNSALSIDYPQHEAFKIATLMMPAQQVSGDFYDFFFIDNNKFAIVIADVSGKGIPSALFMMKAQALIKNIAKSKIGVDEVFYRVNNELYQGNDACMFVTAFMAEIDLTSGKVDYINAGHTPLMIKTKLGYRFLHPQKNIVLGVKLDTEFVAQSLILEPDEHILLYTDGITEAENKSFKFYGADRLLKILQKAKKEPADNLNMILNDVKKFTKGAPQSDDITMLEFAYYGFKKSAIKLDADIKNLDTLIDFIEKDIQKYRFSNKDKFKIVMIAEEIFTNIAQYAYKDEKNQGVEIKTDLVDDIYYMTFIDKGIKYNPLDNKDPEFSSDIKNRHIGGWGIYIVKKIADKIEYTHKNKQNIFQIGIKIKK